MSGDSKAPPGLADGAPAPVSSATPASPRLAPAAAAAVPAAAASSSSTTPDEKRNSGQTALDEADMSFGEPLHVSVSRGTSRFRSIQRTYSKSLSLDEEEEAAAGGGGSGASGSAFDLSTWLTGRQQQQGPPFAKRVGLVFDGLEVYGDNVSNRHIATLATPAYKALKLAAHGFGIAKLFSKEQTHRQIIRGMSGVVADGEMLLVLGRPGAGCSTLLRVLGNRRKTYKRIGGTVSYGGLSPQEVERHYRGEVAYNQEEDVHFPTLTVRKTLEFAIQCKMPSSRMLADRAGYQREFLDTLLDMYGLKGCADTIVGNAFLRGVSGGERKRVSIAEQVASGASVDIWDGSTRGLDSSSALDYVRSLRITTDSLHKATLVTIYQASESIYQLFDKVTVVDDGRQLYFGAANAAVAYFYALGIEKPARQTTSDFLTGVTQLHERRVRAGWEDRVPKTAEEFEAAWKASAEFAALQSEVGTFTQQLAQDGRGGEIRAFVDQTKMGSAGHNALRKRSPYTTTFLFQATRLLRREWEILLGGWAELAFKAVYNAAFAIIVGTLFLRLPATTAGAFTRGGVLFFALLFNSLTAQSEIPKSITGREVVYKHKAFAMYHPAALSIAQTVVDIPFMLLQIVVFSCILYFATGLERTAAQFFIFLLYLFSGCLCLTAFFRLIGNMSPNIDVAHTLSGICLLFMILLVGYMQPPRSMHPWFKWIYWINPLAYGFKALMCNEFRHLQLECTGTNLVPSGPGFDSIDNQVCTLQGARPGVPYVLGRDYLEDGYEFYIKDQWRNFVAVVAFWGFFVIAIALVMEFVEYGNTGYTINVFKRRPPAVPQVAIDEAKDGGGSISDTSSKNNNAPSDELILANTIFTWRDMDYTVPVKGGQRKLLDHVSGYIKPGTMTALMGASGAGKTTLLDALSQRKTIGKLEGEILMNGTTQPKSFRRITGYCEQLDVHNPYATVREALRFSAYLRQPASVPDSEKDEYVQRVILLLGLESISDCLIGDPDSGEGISLEERKRLTIGLELVAKPKILFLDEPTSGLDAQSSFKIVHFMRRLAAEGQTILCTIHQPSALLFEQFDRLLLLVRGGHTVYFGDLGADAQTLIKYFENNGAQKCPPTANPAEYILDVVGSKSSTGIDWPQVWDDSAEKISNLAEIDRINQLKQNNGSAQHTEDDSHVFARSHMYQIKLVTRRMFVMYWRNLEYNMTRLALQVICALVVGFTFYNLNDGSKDLQNKVMAIFECSVLSILVINQVQPEFLRQRQYYGRETSTNQYGWRAFAFAIIVTEWPFSFVANTLFFASFYWTVGLNSISDRIGYFYFTYIILGVFSLTLGQAIASFAPNDIVAAMFNPIFTAMITLFCGVTIPYPQMPKFWRSWMYWLSPYLYYIEGVITNDLHGSKVVCRSDEFYVFEPPSGQTCSEYAGDWASGAIGYINNPDDSSSCQYCPYKVGDEYFTSLNWSFTHRWRNVGIMFGFIVFNIAFTSLMIKIYKVNKR
ncbi:ATP-binding cassette transporter snq2 [Coemansia sp. RSA 1939]|nr:ATP-binding cassette transporter snq2 [Coemansia sp. RSA 1939]KAJ2610238.1 ATP-binding cassette transporter snq2 [Coemansia sp. RSA 1804]KAJ2693985.1 ATP-binding cassette transporter snq2 [Coemansia sp. RSA 1285]